MKTKSIYCTNKFEVLINSRTPHFILRSFVSAKFDCDMSRSEYHIYWYNKNKGLDKEIGMYKCLEVKKMNKKEVRLFYDKLTSYSKVVNNKYGDVWQHKYIGFDKTLVKIKPQLRLF